MPRNSKNPFLSSEEIEAGNRLEKDKSFQSLALGARFTSSLSRYPEYFASPENHPRVESAIYADFDYARIEAFEKGFSDPPTGSLLHIANNPKDSHERDFEKRSNKLFLAAMVLLNIWRLNKENLSGSVNKSIFIIHKIHNISDSSLRSLWSKYKCVSHLGAAELLLYRQNFLPSTKNTESKKEIFLNESSIVHYYYWACDLFNFAYDNLANLDGPSNRLQDPWSDKFTAAIIQSKVKVIPFSSLAWPTTEREREELDSFKGNWRVL